METPLEVAPGTAVRHRTMAEAALERLREAIIMGELTAGTPLRLEDLAHQHARPWWDFYGGKEELQDHFEGWYVKY